MNKYQLVGGIVLMVLAAAIFFLADDTSIAVPIGVLIVGIALVASARRSSR